MDNSEILDYMLHLLCILVSLQSPMVDAITQCATGRMIIITMLDYMLHQILDHSPSLLLITELSLSLKGGI